MQVILKAPLLALVLAVYAEAAFAADPIVGTWQLNLARSTFSPGPAPRSATRTYTESADGITLTVKTTAADGKTSSVTLLTLKYDGKPHAVSGNPDFDSVSVTRVDGSTVHSVQAKGGVRVSTIDRSVAKDGKTLTFKEKGTHADGVTYEDVSVYDRQ
jgi:hypothetical protein